MNMNSFNAIQIAYTKTYHNACDLIEESKLLLDNERYARAHLLAHIAIEEMARCVMLSSAIMKFKIRSLNVKKLRNRETNHKDKIQLAYSMVEHMKGYTSPLSEQDRLEILAKSAVALIGQHIITDQEIDKLNDLKNSSFYTDHYGNETKKPSEVITKELATEMFNSAAVFRDYISFNNWHEGNGLIDLVRNMDNESLTSVKNIYFEGHKTF
ncbi:hypothetical protein GZ22_16855 [Terribacillus saccharophilus]|uniref:HEPN domain-containing protein n=1 Tax=Terribacillus saccharophilus TaxID=361277 RepID=A0A075LN43_9BACI|nr:AbiV family abortive infection protein [Terribacillus goriensis]AIF68135.1 hypothetical protein GZ22_16855 [Terribacillus goriensis]